MTVSIPTWLADSLHHTYPTNWFGEFCAQQKEAFLLTGLPTRRDEGWRQTDLSFFQQENFALTSHEITLNKELLLSQRSSQPGIYITLVNGKFVAELSDTQLLPENVLISSLTTALSKHADLIKPYLTQELNTKSYPFAGLNSAFANDGMVLHVPKNTHVPVPIYLTHVINTDATSMIHPRHILILDESSQVDIVEEYINLNNSRFWQNNFTSVNVGKNAQLTYFKFYQTTFNAFHTATTFVQQKQDSRVRFYNFSTQPKFIRDDLIVSLQEKNAQCETKGFYGLNSDEQSTNYFVDMRHEAVHTKSNMLFKGILKNKTKAMFHGKVYVKPEAQKTEAHQANHHLLLTPNAEASARPELEIYADDVRCKHGATVGQLNTEALFFLTSRGIAREEALAMLLVGFAEEVYDDILDPTIAEKAEYVVKAGLQ